MATLRTALLTVCTLTAWTLTACSTGGDNSEGTCDCEPTPTAAPPTAATNGQNCRSANPGPPVVVPATDDFTIVRDDARFLGSPDRFERLPSGVLKLNEAVYQASGFGNTFLVVTPAGNVVIDTSIRATAQSHRDLLRAVDAGPVKYIILTHAHADHTGGVDLWRQPDTEVIAQGHHGDFVHYQSRVGGALLARNAAQFAVSALAGVGFAEPDAPVDNYGGRVLATTTFEDHMTFELGGLTFQLVHTPGETYDALTVWIPEYRIAFTGDNFYGPFPNLYTLRGTRPRWALDYVNSLDRVLSWEPAVVAPSHGQPVYGGAIAEEMGRYRDAILYVHDATVQGLNAGKSVWQLMQEVQLPPELAVDESYGAVPWSVRGIYEGYLGWFDGNVANMYAEGPDAVHGELVALAGGPGPVVARARGLLSDGDPVRALRLTDVVLTDTPADRDALQVRRGALQVLLDASGNSNERGWLQAAVRETDAALAAP